MMRSLKFDIVNAIVGVAYLASETNIVYNCFFKCQRNFLNVTGKFSGTQTSSFGAFSSVWSIGSRCKANSSRAWPIAYDSVSISAYNDVDQRRARFGMEIPVLLVDPQESVNKVLEMHQLGDKFWSSTSDNLAVTMGTYGRWRCSGIA